MIIGLRDMFVRMVDEKEGFREESQLNRLLRADYIPLLDFLS
jgi:hypothetical protein